MRSQFLQENIFTPLGMKDSGYDSNSAVIARRAAGYANTPNGLVNAGFVHMSIPYSAGALYSTTGDLLKWEQGLFGGKVLSAASLKKMTTAFKNDYAFGLQIDNVNGKKAIQHGGGIEGFNTGLAYYPDDKLTVVVLENMTGGTPPPQISGLLAQVAQGGNVTLPGERKEITLDPKVLARYAGVYQLTPNANFVITVEGNQLISRLTGQPTLPLFAQSETFFFAKAVDAQTEFSGGDDQGRATVLTLHQNGRDLPAKRLSDAEAKPILDADAAITKRFKDQTAAPGSEAALRRTIEELRTGKPNYDLMGQGIANVTRQQLPGLQANIVKLGALQTVTFKGVGPAGADIYEMKFENGAIEFRIALGLDGKTESAGMRPLN